MNEYELQGEKFLADTETTFEAKFLYHGPYFDDDKEKRDVYEITLKRKNQVYTFKFGQSVAKSTNEKAGHLKTCKKFYVWREPCYVAGHRVVPSKPTAYDVLACLTKYDPGTFKDFCGEYGYEEDSRKAEKTYFAVQDEWQNVRKLFGDVLEKLQEIQ